MENLFKSINNYFNDLTFEEENHKYFVKGEPIKKSVSKLIEPYKYPTDWDSVLRNSSIRSGRPESEIKKEWDDAAKLGCDIGDVAHLFGENYLFNKDLKPSSGYEEAIVSFWESVPDHIVIVGLEIKMYHKEYMFAGTADILLYNTLNDTFIIADYKTNKDLYKNFASQKMRKPFQNILCSPLGHYKLQLSFYQILVEQVENVKVSKRLIVWIKPDGTFDIIETEDLTKELKHELKTTDLCL